MSCRGAQFSRGVSRLPHQAPPRWGLLVDGPRSGTRGAALKGPAGAQRPSSLAPIRPAAWSASGQHIRQNGVTGRTTRMYFCRSARFEQTKIELLKRVSAVRICPGAQKTRGHMADPVQASGTCTRLDTRHLVAHSAFHPIEDES